MKLLRSFKMMFYNIKLIIIMLLQTNVNIGNKTIIENNVTIKTYNGTINILEECSVKSGTYLAAVEGGAIEIGKNVFFNRNCTIVCREKVKIGNGCLFGPNICIYDHNHKFSSDGIKEGFRKGEIIVEEGCWIAANCVILKGTHIGKNSIIGAGVVLSGEIPSNSIVRISKENYILEKIVQR